MFENLRTTKQSTDNLIGQNLLQQLQSINQLLDQIETSVNESLRNANNPKDFQYLVIYCAIVKSDYRLVAWIKTEIENHRQKLFSNQEYSIEPLKQLQIEFQKKYHIDNKVTTNPSQQMLHIFNNRYQPTKAEIKQFQVMIDNFETYANQMDNAFTRALEEADKKEQNFPLFEFEMISFDIFYYHEQAKSIEQWLLASNFAPKVSTTLSALVLPIWFSLKCIIIYYTEY